MSKIFKRNTVLLSERNSKKKLIGYARAGDHDVNYLNEQIKSLRLFGCTKIYSELINLTEVNKPQLNEAFQSLSKGDEFIVVRLDRAFQSKSECVKDINILLKRGINIRSLSEGFNSMHSIESFTYIFNILYELDVLESGCSREKKNELLNSRKSRGENLGGRPKISSLKESLVIRLRNEGCSYRTIRAQTGIALSTIRRIILDEASR